MRVTYKGDYALKAVRDLALNYNQGVVTIHGLAKRADVPVKFLEQVLLDLKRGGFVDSKRGIKGGYFLSKPPSEIKLGDVVRFIDGPIEPIDCAGLKNNYKGCAEINKCAFRNIWIKVAKATSDIVDNVTFEDILKDIRNESESINYQI